MLSFVPSNNLLDYPEGLRDAARVSGCLFFRDILDKDAIIDVRRRVLEMCADAGWLDTSRPLAEGIARSGVAWVEPQPEFMVVYERIMRSEAFHALAHQRALLSMFDTLFGEQTLVHARNIARIIFPNNVPFTTPAHQDFIHIQGTAETWTAWFPLGDCPVELGSLAVLPGSHTHGVLPTHVALGAGGQGVDTDSLPHEWAASDFALGDVLIFKSMTVHKGLPNLSPDRIRLSCDFRYQPLSHPAVEASFLPHYARLTWADVYADWKHTRFQYYWKDLPVQYVDWSPQYHARG